MELNNKKILLIDDDVVVNKVNKYLIDSIGFFESIESTGNPFTTPQIYEIKLQVLKAFSTLSDAVARYHESESAAEVQG